MVEGERAVKQVIKNKELDIKHLFFDESQKLWEREAWQNFTRQFQSALAGPAHFAGITDTDNPQGVVALCSIPPETDLQQLARPDGVLVATDRIRDPGNLGTIVRTATWFGVKGLLLGKGTVDLFHPKVVRSTAGTAGTLPYAHSALEPDLERVEKEGWQVLLLDASANSVDIREHHAEAKSIVVVGNEAHGIAPSLMAGNSRKKIRIESPSGSNRVESLNASIALSIALYALSSKVKSEK